MVVISDLSGWDDQVAGAESGQGDHHGAVGRPAAGLGSSTCAACAPVRAKGRAQTVRVRGSASGTPPGGASPRDARRRLPARPRKGDSHNRAGPVVAVGVLGEWAQNAVPPFPGRREPRDFLGSALLGGEGGARSCLRCSAPRWPSSSVTRRLRGLAPARDRPPAGGPETAGMSTRARTDVL